MPTDKPVKDDSRPIPELIAPAGSLEKLKLAYRMGADGCYIGSSAFSMRTRQNRIGLKDIIEARKIADGFGKKLYVCVNIFPRNRQVEKLKKHLDFLGELRPDAIVFADPAVLELAGDSGIPLHLSVQTSTANSLSVKFWRKTGVSRIILARELSLAEIAEIKNEVPDIELEAFVHGSVCMAYSGRCFLSSVFSGRDANQGMCAHNCRDDYRLTSATIQNAAWGEQELDIEEDEHGSHLISSRDMCLLPHLGQLASAGICGFKIEGRNKSEYYLAAVTRTYRKALDDLRAGKKYDPALSEEIAKTGNRGFFSGFYFPELKERTEEHAGRPIPPAGKNHYKARITGVNEAGLEVEVKDRIRKGDSLKLLTEKFGAEKILKIRSIINHRQEETEEVSSGVKAVLKTDCETDPAWEGLVLQNPD
jgi:putative protease